MWNETAQGIIEMVSDLIRSEERLKEDALTQGILNQTDGEAPDQLSGETEEVIINPEYVVQFISNLRRAW